MNGWCKQILEIDLTTQTHKVFPLDMEMARLFLGGRGLDISANLKLWNFFFSRGAGEVVPGGSSLPRECADLHNRSHHGKRFANQQPLQRQHQESSDQRCNAF